MVTRSKSLLIIVGKADILKQDENWQKMIQYCEENGAVASYGRKLKDRILY